MSEALKTAIRRARLRTQGDALGVQAYMGEMAEMKMEELFNGMEAVIAEELRSLAKEEVRKATKDLKNGDKGDKGDKGDTVVGPIGPRGLPGKSIRGPQGKPGKDGVGKQGPKGEPGKDGSKMKKSELLALINQIENGIEISSIKGLQTLLRNIEHALRENGKRASRRTGGGGMGNVQHQATATSSATTTVTTTYRVAGGGFALWVYYNGALLSRGVQYTVGADQKTITFTFSLDDNSTVDIIYHRT